MQLNKIYKSDIYRDINGVIKVSQDDEKVIGQELREYIVTKELHRHFDTFLNNYEKSLSAPTDQIGVWISGFFGSGKSHFLKILSYVLSNRIVEGKCAVDYFSGKFDDPRLFDRLKRCASSDTDTILFNIDSKSSVNKDSTAILRVFQKVFYEYRGYYGDDLKVAKLEQFIDRSGKKEEFCRKFLSIHGDTWENSRNSFTFFEDDVVEVLTEVLGMSEQSARNWFNGSETSDVSIDTLVKEIKEYVDSKGKEFRLIFMIDEVGQYIGSDGSLMLNLQTIVEEIGSKCAGRVWVMVTSQEDIDSVTTDAGSDFSKILGRFSIRLSLSSSSVDEVIKRRILAKTDKASAMLSRSYRKNGSVLRNLFTFTDPSSDLKGYSGENDFIETYPFVSYQFPLMQKVFEQIRKNGNSGRHLSGGERSMLSGFMEAARSVGDRDENALVPFYLFYETVQTYLDGSIRRVIDRCGAEAENGDLITEFDVSVLKLLYLIRYLDGIKANVDNLATLAVDDIRADKIAVRSAICCSLDRLVREKYISRNGDTYTFLTDDEQKIESEIRCIPTDNALIIREISRIIFGELYPNKKIRFGKYVFPYDQIVDDTAYGHITGAVMLRFVTSAGDMIGFPENYYVTKSHFDHEAIFLLPNSYPYYEDLDNASKIKKFIKTKNVAQYPEQIQRIIRAKNDQAVSLEKSAKEHIVSAISEAKVYAAGDLLTIKNSDVKDKIRSALTFLIENVYTKLGYIKRNFDKYEELSELLTDGHGKSGQISGKCAENREAVEEVYRYLCIQQEKKRSVSMGDLQRRYSSVPFGWRDIDTASVIISLYVSGRVDISCSDDADRQNVSALIASLAKKGDLDKTSISLKIKNDPKLVRAAREFLKEYFNTMDLPSDEDGLISFIYDRFTAERDAFAALLETQYPQRKYPGRETVERGLEICDELLSKRDDSGAFLESLNGLRDDFLDLSEDMSYVYSFFKNQKTVFDGASDLISSLEFEMEYIQPDTDVFSDVSCVRQILGMKRPFKRISELPALVQRIKTAYALLFDLKKKETLSEIEAYASAIQRLATVDKSVIACEAYADIENKKRMTAGSRTLTELDAMRTRISDVRKKYIVSLLAIDSGISDPAELPAGCVCSPASLKSEEEIDEYVEALKRELKDKLKGHEALYII